LYDALLDDLHGDATSQNEEATTIDANTGADFEEDVIKEDVNALEEGQAFEEDEFETKLVADETESENWSDDPVRMYLTQMGEIPLLTRQEEIALARSIETSRDRFRRKLLECDHAMQTAYRTLCRVASGELPFDRTIQTSSTNDLEKQQILGRLPHNLRTLEALLKRNRRDYHIALSKSRPKAERRAAWRRLGRRRLRAVRLVEECSLRTPRLEAMIKTLEEYS